MMKNMRESFLWAAYVMQQKDAVVLYSMESEQRRVYMEDVEGMFINTVIDMMELYQYGAYFVDFMNHLLNANTVENVWQSFSMWQVDEINRMYIRISDLSRDYFLNYVQQKDDSRLCCSEKEILSLLFDDWLKIIQTARDNKYCVLISYE